MILPNVDDIDISEVAGELIVDAIYRVERLKSRLQLMRDGSIPRGAAGGLFPTVLRVLEECEREFGGLVEE